MIFNSFSTIMSVILFSTITTVCCIFLKHTRSCHLWIISLIIGLCILRCILPVEITGAITINCWEIYPILYNFTQLKIYNEFTIEHIIYTVWFLGFIILFIKQIIEVYRQILMIKSLHFFPRTNERIHKLASKVAFELKCHKKVDIYIQSCIPTAAMIGFFHPVIVFPYSMLQLDDNELEHILRHEISHYKGGDTWIRMLIQFLICTLWWNPAVYLLRRCVIQLLELRSDRLACNFLSEKERSQYSSVLIKTLKNAIKTSRSTLASGFTGNYYNGFFRQRIEILLSPSPPKPPLWKIVLTTSICILLFIGSYLFIFQPAFAPPIETGYILSTNENSWIISIGDGQYEVWVNGSYLATISSESLSTSPFNQYPIYEKENMPK